MRPPVAAATELRYLLDYEPDTLVRGFMLLTPGQRARIRLALERADSPCIVVKETPMSVIGNLETEVEKVFHAVETEVAKVDGQALAEARKLLADAKAAESKLVTLTANYKTEIAALVTKFGPEAVAAVEAEMARFLADIKSLFGTSGA